ncbi:MAG: hypothetical protein JWO22_4239 [Frankiales bacterium]|nr:hypothetical protein [Frankiales bacterium]
MRNTTTGSVFQREYDAVRVTDVRATDGAVLLRVTWASAYLFVLDDDGVPASILREGPGGFEWQLPLPDVDDEQRELLEAMAGEGSLTETGTLGRECERLLSRSPQTANGVRIESC